MLICSVLPREGLEPLCIHLTRAGSSGSHVPGCWGVSRTLIIVLSTALPLGDEASLFSAPNADHAHSFRKQLTACEGCVSISLQAISPRSGVLFIAEIKLPSADNLDLSNVLSFHG